MARVGPLQLPNLESSENAVSKKVVVTGGTGYVGAHCVLRCLEAGHIVTATVRNPESTAARELLTLPGAPQRLKLVKADLNAGVDVWTAALAGADILMHVAAVFSNQLTGKKAEELMIKPAVQGTETVLKAAEKAGVKRVVLTSTMLAVFGEPLEHGEGVTLGPEHWNNTSTASYNPYPYSKTQQEKAARKLAKDQSTYTLSTVNPGFVMGPPATTRLDGESVNMVQDMFKGRFAKCPDISFPCTDVRDVAKAHLLSAMTADGPDRIMCCEPNSYSILDLATIAREHTGFTKLGNGIAPKGLLLCLACCIPFLDGRVIKAAWGESLVFNNRSLTSVGVTAPIPVKESLAAMCDAMKARGMVKY